MFQNNLKALKSALGLHGSFYAGAQLAREGHHGTSVSRAFGQFAMDAVVITWKALPPFPWKAAREAVIAE